MDIGILIARLVLGFAVAAHGAQKLFGWFGGHGVEGTGENFEGLGFHPGNAFAALAGCGEFFGGLLVAFGFLGALGPSLVIVVMTVAILTVHVANGFFSSNNGMELPLAYAAGVFAIASSGFGVYSLDAALGVNVLATPAATYASVIVAIVVAVLTVSLRHLPEHHAPVRR